MPSVDAIVEHGVLTDAHQYLDFLREGDVP